MENKLIAHSLIMFKNKYLVIKRSDIKRGEKNYYPSYWDIPGGSVEDGELPRQARNQRVSRGSWPSYFIRKHYS